MPTSVTAVISAIAEAAGSVIGYRHRTAEPECTSENLSRAVQIRKYGRRFAAETTVHADEHSARNVGFRRLARYIFGANQVQEKIAMTAPVAQCRELAAEPVDDDGREWVIRFFMPADKTLDSLPEPDDDEVTLVEVPPQTIAVRRFAGSATPRAVATQTARLLTTLSEFGFETAGTPTTWFYDPPWTVPALRRNEIAVLVQSAR